jgi:regulatory protein
MKEKSAVKWTKDNALANARRYCVYQERCHSEVRNKLLSHGLHGDFLEEIISCLIEEDYLNEERFAIQYAGGKHRIKGWGRHKIEMELRKKQVSAYSIRVALQSIGQDDYHDQIIRVLERRMQYVADKMKEVHEHEIVQFGLRKGYSYEEVQTALKAIRDKGDQ